MDTHRETKTGGRENEKQSDDHIKEENDLEGK